MRGMTGLDRGRTLSPEQARSVYNRIGRVQDWQSFYETAPIGDMIAHSGFPLATSVYELGCGTGALAARLLGEELDDAATYLGVDVSDTMVSMTTDRIARWSDRARVQLVSGDLPLPGRDHHFDRFVATFVFDLLDEGYASRILDEALRLLTSDGLVCIVSLTEGTTPMSSVVAGGWRSIWRSAPRLVGGCRPVDMATMLTDRWKPVHHRVITSWAVPSEILVARPLI